MLRQNIVQVAASYKPETMGTIIKLILRLAALQLPHLQLLSVVLPLYVKEEVYC
jgi:hypothetical protein